MQKICTILHNMHHSFCLLCICFAYAQCTIGKNYAERAKNMREICKKNGEYEKKNSKKYAAGLTYMHRVQYAEYAKICNIFVKYAVYANHWHHDVMNMQNMHRGLCCPQQ